MWTVWHVMSEGSRIPQKVATLILQFAEFPSNVFHFIYKGFDTESRLILNHTDQVYNGQYITPKEIGYSLLLSSYLKGDSLQFKLLRGDDLSVIKIWKVPESVIMKSRDYSGNEIPRRLNHPLLLEDSSLVSSSHALYRIRKDNSFIWVNKSRKFHHAIEKQGDSIIWTGSRINGNKYFNFNKDTLLNDAICAVDVNSGSIKYEKSVAEILVENGYMHLLQIGKHEPDLIHLNDIQPVSGNGKFWKAGDLFISMRHRNTVFLYRPATNKILWLKTGPWLAQHDVDVVDDKTIMIFGNDVLRGKENHFFNGHNEVYFYDFEKDSVYRPYTNMMRKLNIRTIFEGRSDLLLNGDLFIDETNNGKLYVITKDSLKMKYVERIDDKHIKMFNWVRPIFN